MFRGYSSDHQACRRSYIRAHRTLICEFNSYCCQQYFLTFYSGIIAQQTTRGLSPAVPATVRFEKYYRTELDRKSTRLNSSHLVNSYAVFCLKKKKYTK